MPHVHAPKGLLAATTALLKTTVAIGHTRLHLLALDLEEERLYLLQTIKWMLLAAVSLAIGSLLLAGLMVSLFWDSHRLLVLTLLSAVFILVGLVSWRCVIVKLRKKPALFGGSLAELVKDWQAMHAPEREG